MDKTLKTVQAKVSYRLYRSAEKSESCIFNFHLYHLKSCWPLKAGVNMYICNPKANPGASPPPSPAKT